MSEFQGYAFRAVDRPLTRKEIDEVSSYSSRAEVTPTSFSVSYSYSSFKGSVKEFMTKYFDVFVYVANWGTQRVMFRVPKSCIDATAAALYQADDHFAITPVGDHLLIDLTSSPEGFSDWLDENIADHCLASLVPVRDELLKGDLRPLYIGWLSGLSEGVVEDEEDEPPVPLGLLPLSEPLKELAEFLRVNESLLEVAARASGPTTAPELTPEGMAKWIAKLAATEKNALLLDLLQGSTPNLGRVLMQRCRQETLPKLAPGNASGRTAGELLRLLESWEENKKTLRSAAAAAARAAQLDSFRGKEESLWKQAQTCIDAKSVKQYDASDSRVT